MTGRTASCPSCGAPIEFRNAATITVICASCGGTSTREGLDLRKVGKIAEVTPLDSLLEIGTTGRFEGKAWMAVGQVQLDFGAGHRNLPIARVEMQFAVLESGSSLVLGIDDQDAYLGTRNGAAGELVRTHRMRGFAAGAPHTFAVVFHGDVFVATVDGKKVGSVAAPKDLSAGRTIRVAVEGGTGFFSDIDLLRMKKP